MSSDGVANPLIEAMDLVPHGEVLPMNIRLQRDDFLCLIGPESQRLIHFLRTLAGVEPFHTGELRLFGRPLKSMDRNSWREQRQHIGYVARSAPLLSVLRGLDNVMLPALYHKRMSRVEAKKKALELIADLDCKGDIRKLPAYLSQQQRLQLAIARATILGPSLLFLEEPFFALSLAEQEPIFQYIKRSRDKFSLALATHNLRLVKESATQILFIGNSQLHHFHNWHELVQCGDEEVSHYMLQYRQQYQPV
jgi:polar amino acid transport system ATP-binding protein